MYENVFTILVVGMSIDYSVHLAHFYNEAMGTRYEKAQACLDPHPPTPDPREHGRERSCSPQAGWVSPCKTGRGRRGAIWA